MDNVLKPKFAGSFYPSDPLTLEVTVKQYLDNDSIIYEDAIGMVVPHAGYVYSGKTAGYGFSSAPTKKSTIVIIAPSHKFPFRGETVFNSDFLETPLGVCPINKQVTKALATEMETFVFNEHSLEVLIPFVQIKWPEAEIVPIVLGIEPDCEKVAGLLHKYVPDAFVIASSDLSHFYPQNVAERIDRLTINAFLSLSAEKLKKNLEACGKTAIQILLLFAELSNASKAIELDYSTSAAAGGDKESVVGYFSGIVV